jgi:hypothetical protein
MNQLIDHLVIVCHILPPLPASSQGPGGLLEDLWTTLPQAPFSEADAPEELCLGFVTTNRDGYVTYVMIFYC